MVFQLFMLYYRNLLTLPNTLIYRAQTYSSFNIIICVNYCPLLLYISLLVFFNHQTKLKGIFQWLLQINIIW